MRTFTIPSVILTLFLAYCSLASPVYDSMETAKLRIASLMDLVDTNKDRSLQWAELKPQSGRSVSKSISTLKLPEKEIQTFNHRFDTNGDGLWADQELRNLFQTLDRDGDEKVSGAELSAALMTTDKA